MLLQSLLQHFAVAIIVFNGSNLRYAPEALESLKVRLIDVSEVGVRDDDVWQGLDVTQAVRESGVLSKCGSVNPWRLLPCW